MNWARIFFGSVVVAVGVLLLLDNAGVLDAGNAFSTYWPVLVIGAGLFAFLSNPGHWQIPLIVVVVGTALLLRTLDVVDSLSVVIPALLILIGVFVMFGRGRPGQEVTNSDRISSFNIFSGTEIASHSAEFKGGNVGAIFGGAEIDLHDAKLAPGALLDVVAVFGGVEVSVPQGWQVVTRGFPIFGGFENVTAKERTGADAPMLQVNATILFGGVEIKH
ncbi:MAG: cell wall-active antibiotics response protein [Actinomycetota bacterium]|nr:cell wall-active antibiotics response protein [Actinomycetota bacterium]